MVRASASFSARPEWYDRNPTPYLLSYSGSAVAPHSVTTRDSYAIPAGKTAVVSIATGMIMRVTAATTLGRAYILVGTSTSCALFLFHKSNTVDSLVQEMVPCQFTIGAGITVSIVTADGSTGGTMDYEAKVTLTIFDA